MQRDPTVDSQAGQAERSETDEERRQNVNDGLVEVLNMHSTDEPSAHMQGLGLYTHVPSGSLGPNYGPATPNPIFLPIGGPRLFERKRPPRAQISPEVRAAFLELSEAVNSEKKILAHLVIDLPRLKERYGVEVEAMDTPNLQGRSKSWSHMQQERSEDEADKHKRRRSLAVANSYDPGRDPRVRAKRKRVD